MKGIYGWKLILIKEVVAEVGWIYQWTTKNLDFKLSFKWI